MDFQEIYESAKNDPELESKLDINKLLANADENQNAYLKNETLETITRTIFDTVSSINNISENEAKSICEKLKGYRYVDNLCDLRSGLHIKWIRLGTHTPKMKSGALVSNIKIGESANVLCRHFNQKFFTIRFEDHIIFQKLSPEEEIILSMS